MYTAGLVKVNSAADEKLIVKSTVQRSKYSEICLVLHVFSLNPRTIFC